MAEPRRFLFDSETRSVDVPNARRRVAWLWVAISVAIHGAIVLFVLAGAARGGHSELAGTLEVTVVGAPSAGDPAGTSSAEPAEEKPPPDAAATRPDAAPAPPQPDALPRPPSAEPAGPTEPQPPPSQNAAIPEAPAPTPPDPEGMARPAPSAAPAPPTPRPRAAEADPIRPSAPRKAGSQPVPPRPKAAPNARAAPSQRRATGPKQGLENAPRGQTASLGAPTGGDRLGRSDNDDSSGLLNINLKPRFRVPPAPPHYPRQSVERDEEGIVLVRAFVDAGGAPQRVLVFKGSGFPLLDEAALKAVRGWRFEPMVREGRTIAAWVQVPVRFRLN